MLQPAEIAAAIAVFGGAVITLSSIGYAVYKAAASAFSLAVKVHVAPLFQELRVSLMTLNSTMGALKSDHALHACRVEDRLNAHDDDIGELNERAARIEGRMS